MRRLTAAAASSFFLFALVPSAFAQVPAVLPLKYSGPPTVADITSGDLMTRIYIFADDSLRGRQVGSEWALRGAAYIEREVRRLGLTPAGENGGYLQDLPMGVRLLDSTSTLTVGSATLRAGSDFLATISGGGAKQLSGVEVVYGGVLYDTLNLPSGNAWRGKLVLLRPFVPGPNFNAGVFVASAGYTRSTAKLATAAGIVIITGSALTPAAIRASFEGGNNTYLRAGDSSLGLSVTERAAETLLGRPLAGARLGTRGKRVNVDVRIRDVRRDGGRNVVAILPGSDPVLRNQYVAIGAHNDAVGTARTSVDHDSILAFNRIVRAQGADSDNRPATDDENVVIRAIIDSLRRVNTPRRDSIRNGADDDGSGSMGLLEIAEMMAAMPVKPKRSILFVWHTGEESGMWGSGYYTDHPTVPRDSIVAQLNIDMIGRGARTDVTGNAKGGGLLHGDDRYLQILGSRRLSTELGDLVDEVNGVRPFSFRLDYAMDANGHPQNIYCRSDHYSYARYGIPIAFFTTGGHADYHQVTDEPQYIRYEHAAEVARFISEVGLRLADQPARPVLDKPVPDRTAGCRQ